MHHLRLSYRSAARSFRDNLLPQALLASASLLLLVTCGGGGGGGTAATTVTGSVYASPTAGASVTVRDGAGALVAGPVAAGADGAYRIAVPDNALSVALRFESSGGTFVDEATGVATAGGRLSAYVPGGTLASGSSVHLTPVSTLADNLVARGKTLAESRNVLASALGFYDNVSVAPRNDNATTMGGMDNVARRLAALRAMAFSRLAYELGLSADNQFNLIGAMGEDLADGTLDGKNGAVPVEVVTGLPLPEDIQNRFGNALAYCIANVSMNRTGLTADQVGSPPCGTVALTPTYRIEYLPVDNAMMGRSRIDLKVTRRSDNSAVTGLVPGSTLRLVPWMYMATKSHSSPVDNAVVETVPGTYSFTIYYLMASATGTTSMGFWELKFVVDGETALFHPYVGMPAGDTPRAVLKGTNDNAASSPVGPRSYFLFKDGAVTGTAGNHTFNLFLAAYDNQSTYPQLEVGTVLRDPAGTPWAVDNVAVEASTDNTTWIGGTNTGGAHWSVSALPGLAAPSGTVFVRVYVNGEQKTTDGFAPSGPNGYATFSVPVP
jgi:hypothetical protein